MKTIVLFLMLAACSLAYADSNQPPISISNRLNTKVIDFTIISQRADNVLELLLTAVSAPESVWNQPIGLVYTNPPPKYTPQLDHSLSIWSNMPLLTMDLGEPSFREAFDYIAKTLNLRYEVKDTKILFFTHDGMLLNQQ